MAGQFSDAAISSAASRYSLFGRISAVTALTSPLPAGEQSDSSTNLQCFESALIGPPESPAPSFLHSLPSPCRLRGPVCSPGSLNAGTPTRRRRASCVDGSALFRTPAHAEEESLRYLWTEQLAEPQFEQLMEPQLDQILQPPMRPTRMLGLTASCPPAVNCVSSNGGASTPAPAEDPHRLPFSARQRLFERDSARRDSDGPVCVRTVLFRESETAGQEQCVTSLKAPLPAVTEMAAELVSVVQVEGESVPVGEAAAVKDGNLLENEIDNTTSATTTRDASVASPRVVERVMQRPCEKSAKSPPSHSPDTSFADVGVGRSRRIRSELVRREIALQEWEEWRTKRIESIDNRERAVSGREQQLGNRELALSGHEQSNSVREHQLIDRERAVARDEQASSEKDRVFGRLEQALLERERAAVRQEKAAAFHLGALHAMRDAAGAGHHATPKSDEGAQDNQPPREAVPTSPGAMTRNLKAARGVVCRAVRVSWCCWRVVGSLLTLRALVLALPLEHRATLVPTWFHSASEKPATQTCLQWESALEPGLEERTPVVLLPKANSFVPTSFDSVLASRDMVGDVNVTAEVRVEPSANDAESTSLQVARNDQRFGFTSVIGMGGGLMVYVATFIRG